MSGQIPFHVQEEILKRLPVKSLIRFRSVCKAWRCLIDSAYFIATHTVGKDECQQLLIKYVVGEEARYVSIVDDDTFPQQRFVPALPLSVQLLKRSCLAVAVMGCCASVAIIMLQRDLIPTMKSGWFYFGILQSENRLLLMCL